MLLVLKNLAQEAGCRRALGQADIVGELTSMAMQSGQTLQQDQNNRESLVNISQWKLVSKNFSEYSGFNYGHFCWTDKRAADEDADKKSDKYCFFPSGTLESSFYTKITVMILDFSSSSPSTLCRRTSWASLCDRNRRSCRNREEQRS